MTERNRVAPLGDIVRFHATDLWITCALAYPGPWNRQWQPHHDTYLFFHDEAVAFAAGHRPCAEFRRTDYNAYRQACAGYPVQIDDTAR